jgi:hypothetical protein
MLCWLSPENDGLVAGLILEMLVMVAGLILKMV